MVPIKKKNQENAQESEVCMEIPLNQAGLKKEDDFLRVETSKIEIHSDQEDHQDTTTITLDVDPLKNMKRKIAMQKMVSKKKKINLPTPEELIAFMGRRNDFLTANSECEEHDSPSDQRKEIYIEEDVANGIEYNRRIETGNDRIIDSFDREFRERALKKKKKSFTTFTEQCLTEEQVHWIIDNFDQNLEVQSLLSSNMATTSTSCTTVPIQTEVVDVPSLNILKKPKKSAEDIQEELFPVGN